MSRKYDASVTPDIIREGQDVLLLQNSVEDLRKIRPSNGELDARLLPTIYGANVDFVTESAPIKYTTRSN